MRLIRIDIPAKDAPYFRNDLVPIQYIGKERVVVKKVGKKESFVRYCCAFGMGIPTAIQMFLMNLIDALFEFLYKFLGQCVFNDEISEFVNIFTAQISLVAISSCRLRSRKRLRD